ncbi:Uncharacterized protein Adt_02828 [Abeliophyllum distichum]|uniref:Uncharacterized protein n=1 Tax=Abeliophyllum distichum TaxID=126358 RepID=A0ABD1W044_9LAMI
MDLNMNCKFPSWNGELRKNGNIRCTTLRLDCFGYRGPDSAVFGSSLTKDRGQSIYANASDDGCKLSASDALHHRDRMFLDGHRIAIPVVDEGSTLAKKFGSYTPTLLLANRMESSKISLMTDEVLNFGEKSHYQVFELSVELSRVSNKSMSTISEPTLPRASSDNKTSNPKDASLSNVQKEHNGELVFVLAMGANNN